MASPSRKSGGVGACLAAVVALLGSGIPAWATAWPTVMLEPALDTTLYESEADAPPAQNELSNGSGIFLFAGRTGLDGGFRARRALLKFDLGSLPAGAEILFAELVLYQSRAAPGAPPSAMSLHRLKQEWGEGKSDAAGPEGQGALAEPGDATWFHRIYDTQDWGEPGGDFAAEASASTTVGTQEAVPFVWGCSQAMLDDLNAWLSEPAANFGWLLMGFEDGAGNAHRFHSRQHTDASTRPSLRLVYRAGDALLYDGFETRPTCE